jgi:hypothetical protein
MLTILMVLAACVLKAPGESDSWDILGGESSGGSSGGATGSTSGGTLTGNATTGDGGMSTGDATTTGGGTITGNATVTGDVSTSAAPEPLPDGLQVLVLHAEPGPHSGFEGVPLWQSGDGQSCQDAPPVDCAAAPVIGAPKLLANGAVVGPDAVQAGSRVGVIFPYAHPECALGCGDYEATVLIGDGGDGVGAIGLFSVDLPCSTEEGSVWLGVDFNVVAAQPYSAELVVTDRCGKTSEPQKVAFAGQ